MSSWLPRIVSLTLALVLSGTPSVAAVCVAVCSSDVSAGHAEAHHMPAPVEQHAADPMAAVAEHHQHHDAASNEARSGAGEVAAPPPTATVVSARTCCSDMGSVTLTPARVKARADVAPPLVGPPAANAVARVLPASLAHDPPASPPPPPAPLRSPLILRI